MIKRVWLIKVIALYNVEPILKIYKLYKLYKLIVLQTTLGLYRAISKLDVKFIHKVYKIYKTGIFKPKSLILDAIQCNIRKQN